ncbi:MAG: hypothetical protein EZS28_011708 [Streblomastix strix]|uniref:Uncharacterized protein n=1 Tax=Streblomastix strix TaxID=222440 RepID=A0A5J4WCX1_9EUKA|nr:MAG: hypothetical protein EZS28_011708 [Streblomastix strix]
MLIIAQFSDRIKSDVSDEYNMSLELLSYLAVNRDNHEAIIAGGGIETASQYIQEKSEVKGIESNALTSFNNALI